MFTNSNTLKNILKGDDGKFVSEEASRIYLRYAEGDECGSIRLEDFNAHVVSRIPRKIGESNYTMVEVWIGDELCHAIEEFALRLSRRRRIDERDLDSLYESHAFSEYDIADSRYGTLCYAEALSSTFHARRSRLKQLPRFVYKTESADEHSPVFDSEPLRPVVKLAVPPRLHHPHACNRATGEPVIEPYPDLDAAWSTFRARLYAARENGQRVVYEKVKQSLPQTDSLDYETVRLVHPNYGKYGVFKFALKDDFKGYVDPVHEFIPHTYSTAIAPHVPAVLYRWNRKDPMTNLYSGAGRLGRLPQPVKNVDLPLMTPYIDAAVDWLINELKEAGMNVYDNVPNMEVAWQWLACAPFPAAKKAKYAEEFLKASDGMDNIKSAILLDYTHKAFPKNECYLAGDKPQRQILAGSLQAAAALAPICDMLGNVFFSMDFTSKKIPVRARPRVAIERFGMDAVILNDMSAFEGSITRDIKRLVEHRVMKEFFPQYAPYIDRCEEDITCHVAGAHFSLPNCRCSGDPQTSLGNSITNIVSIVAAMYYAYDIVDGVGQLPYDNLPVAWVEGDDSLVKWPAKWGKVSSRNKYFVAYHDAFVKMGFATKMEIKDFVGNAGYCSMYFTERAKNSPSVAQTLLDLPWDHNNSHRGEDLLRMKVNSVAAEAPGQPITCAMVAKYAGRHFCIRVPYNTYEYEEALREGFSVTLDHSSMIVEGTVNQYDMPDEDDRKLFERRYGISPRRQKEIERALYSRGLPALWNDFRRELRRICRVDGIDLDACHQFYLDNVNREEEPEGWSEQKQFRVVDGKLVERDRKIKRPSKMPRPFAEPNRTGPIPLSPIEEALEERRLRKDKIKELFKKEDAAYIRAYARIHGSHKTRKMWRKTHPVHIPWKKIIIVTMCVLVSAFLVCRACMKMLAHQQFIESADYGWRGTHGEESMPFNRPAYEVTFCCREPHTCEYVEELYM